MKKIYIYTFAALLTSVVFNLNNVYAAGSPGISCDNSIVEGSEREVKYSDMIRFEVEASSGLTGNGFLFKNLIKLEETVSCGTRATLTLDNSSPVLGTELKMLTIGLVASGGPSFRILRNPGTFGFSPSSWEGHEVSFFMQTGVSYRLLFTVQATSQIVTTIPSASLEVRDK